MKKKKPTVAKAPRPSKAIAVVKRKRHPSKREVLAILKTKDERALFQEVAAKTVSVVKGAEDLLQDYGEWLFIHLFASDTHAVLDDNKETAVWTALLQLADHGKLPLSRATISNSVRVAAYDKRLADGAWSALGFTLKTSLLPLRDPTLMREAARHVLSTSLSVREARVYVDNTLHPNNTKAIRLSPKGAKRAVGALHKKLAEPKFLSKLGSALGRLPKDERAAASEELHSMIEGLKRLLDAVKK